MKCPITFLCAMLLAAAAQAAPRPDDYAQGLELLVSPDRPLAETLLPDNVYRIVTRADLSDVRVFNGAGTPVPHAFCPPIVKSEPVITRQPLSVFDLQASGDDQTGGTHIDVQTAAGTQIKVQEGSTGEGPREARVQAHVIDARSVTGPLRSIEFDWRSPDGASQAKVRIEASDDLDKWRTVVPDSTLLRVTRNGETLQRKQIPLPVQQYQYLRVQRVDRGPALVIEEVQAEQIITPPVPEPVWFTAQRMTTARAQDENKELLFDAGRLAPISYARLILPQDNSSVRVRIQSRNDAKQQWRERWSGEFFSITTEGEHRSSPPAEFTGDPDRYWRVQYTIQSDTLIEAPALELGYRPVRLRFLTQGSGPFTLAYGSQRAESSPGQQCNSLLAGVKEKELAAMVEQAQTGAERTLGGATAFKPLPRQTPVRLVVLWGVLIAGVGVLVAMALALLKRTRQAGQEPSDG